MPTLVHCEVCNGSGAHTGSSAQTCPTCHGSGQVQMRQGFFAVQQACPHCHGRGKIIRIRAASVMARSLPEDQDPVGQDPGWRRHWRSHPSLRRRGSGEAGAPAGDLYVQVHVKEHGSSCVTATTSTAKCPSALPRRPWVADRSADPGWPGQAQGHPETQTGKMFRMRGKGVKSVRSGQVGI